MLSPTNSKTLQAFAPLSLANTERASRAIILLSSA
jgi:hypothetical protein